MQQALETFMAGADPALTAAWGCFISEQDARYARRALELGEPYSTFTEAEVREVATLAAALGVTPDDAVARQDWQSTDRLRDRVPLAVG